MKAKPDEEVHLCQGYIFDEAAADLKKTLDEKLVQRIRVVGEPQRLTEIAYLDEIRNLGYEPLAEREEKRAKSFFHMMRWLKAHPEMLEIRENRMAEVKALPPVQRKLRKVKSQKCCIMRSAASAESSVRCRLSLTRTDPFTARFVGGSGSGNGVGSRAGLD